MKIRAHETFSIRKGWIHKGVKNIAIYPRLFTDKSLNPCDILGIGANMVKSLRYWMSAVGVMEEVSEGNQKIQRLTELGRIIDNNDKFYEEDGTLWALHYKLASNMELATAWYWYFNVFKMSSCDKELFVKELGEYLHTEFGYDCSENMLADEFDCIIKTYCVKDKNISPENTTVCPLTELRLLAQTVEKDFKKCIPDKDSLHPLIILGAICDSSESDEILIADLMNKEGSIAKLFNLDRATCFYYLEQLRQRGYITISRTAGLDVIKILKRANFNEALSLYYIEISGEGNK